MQLTTPPHPAPMPQTAVALVPASPQWGEARPNRTVTLPRPVGGEAGHVSFRGRVRGKS